MERSRREEVWIFGMLAVQLCEVSKPLEVPMVLLGSAPVVIYKVLSALMSPHKVENIPCVSSGVFRTEAAAVLPDALSCLAGFSVRFLAFTLLSVECFSGLRVRALLISVSLSRTSLLSVRLSTGAPTDCLRACAGFSIPAPDGTRGRLDIEELGFTDLRSAVEGLTFGGLREDMVATVWFHRELAMFVVAVS
jgi:hypothetical protein